MIKRAFLIASCLLCVCMPAFADATSDLINAIYQKDDSAFIQAIANVDETVINVPDANGLTLLMRAAGSGYLNGVTILIDNFQKLDFNAQDSQGTTALMFAVSNKHTSIVKKLAENKNVKMNVPNNYGDTALILAVKTQKADIVQLLVNRKDTDLNKQGDGGLTALMHAVIQGDYELACILLTDKSRINLTITNDADFTALELAEYRNKNAIAELIRMVEQGMSVLQTRCDGNNSNKRTGLSASGGKPNVCTVDTNNSQENMSESPEEQIQKAVDFLSSRLLPPPSHWKNASGGFNTARLASDSVAGVVLGTAGGLITSNVIKKNQTKSGFENIQCTINGQNVASYGDDFVVGTQITNFN